MNTHRNETGLMITLSLVRGGVNGEMGGWLFHTPDCLETGLE